MSLFDSLKSMLAGPEVPPETREAVTRATGYRELLAAIDRICTANEVKLREIEREIRSLEGVERSEIERLREDQPSEREKKLILQRIERVRKQIRILDDKIDIHTKNIDLHQNLMGKIQRVESMSMQAIDEKLIDEVLGDFEEQFERYKNVMHAGMAADEVSTSPLTSKDRASLRALEEELLGKPEEAEQASPAREQQAQASAEKSPERERTNADEANRAQNTGESRLEGERARERAKPERELETE